MSKNFDLIARECIEQRLRARVAEDRLRTVVNMLGALSMTMWCTDRQLRLTETYGMTVAEAFVDCHIGDFYREVYGLDEEEADPVAAHVEARAGQGA